MNHSHVSRKSQAMRIMRFGREDYSRMMLDMQASLMGLNGWDDIITEEEKKYAQGQNGRPMSVTESPEFLRAKGE